MERHANYVNSITGAMNTSSRYRTVSTSSGSGCAGCSIQLEPEETYCCESCAAFYEMTDPNGYGDDDG